MLARTSVAYGHHVDHRSEVTEVIIPQIARDITDVACSQANSRPRPRVAPRARPPSTIGTRPKEAGRVVIHAQLELPAVPVSVPLRYARGYTPVVPANRHNTRAVSNSHRASRDLPPRCSARAVLSSVVACSGAPLASSPGTRCRTPYNACPASILPYGH